MHVQLRTSQGLAGKRKMQGELDIIIADGILRVSSSGPFNLHNAKTFFQEVIRRAREEGVHNILIDVCGINTVVATMERFGFGSYVAELSAQAFKVAFVCREDQVWSDRFMENVSVNRGSDVRVFTTLAEAMDWLAE